MPASPRSVTCHRPFAARAWAFACLTFGLLIANAHAAPTLLDERLESRSAPRVRTPIDNADRVRLTDTLSPLARSVPAGTPVPHNRTLRHMVLQLRPSSEQALALEDWLAQQHDPTSPRYRQWLSPAEFGQRFGLAQADIEAVRAWLLERGFEVDDVPAGARTIVFSGTAGQLRSAFGMQLRQVEVSGRRILLPDAEPSVPAALAEVIDGLVSLSDLHSRPLHRSTPLPDSAVSRKAASPAEAPSPQATFGNSHYLAANDFHTIYNLKTVLQQGVTGAGRSIAIVGRSNIVIEDVNQFRSNMALPANPPQVVVAGTLPGFVSGDELEANLDVEWAGAVAPGATVKYVVAASTTTSDGVALAAQHAVNNDIGDVISVSYGLCEAAMGRTATNFYSSLWQQAAAQGQTVVVSSGDSGAAGCDLASSSTATGGQGVNGLCTSPYSTCVGGTQFNDTANPSAWWSVNNDAGLGSALSHIPEVAWNESASNGGSQLWSTGGGVSLYINKPSWQNRSWMPALSRRGVPDVSLAASIRTGYLVVSRDNATRTPNTYVVGGTSASAPALAGILALVGQTTGYRLGNINPTLYGLANAQLGGGGSYFHAITAGNNSVPGVTGFSASASSPGYNLATGLGTVNGANFVQGYTDLLPTSQTSLTLGSSSVVSGQTVTLTATVSGAGSTGSVQFLDNGAPLDGPRPLSGGQATLTTSALQVGVHSIVARFSGTASLRSSSSTPAALTVQAVASVAVSATPASLRAGEVIALQASVSGNNPSGWVQFTDGGSPLGAPVALSNGVANWSGNALRRSGTHQVSAQYGGDALNTAATAANVSVQVGVALTSTALQASPVELSPGQAVTLTATVSGVDVGGSVVFSDQSGVLGNASLSGAQATLTLPFSVPGSRLITASYSGDANNAASTSAPLEVKVLAATNEADGDVPTLPGWGALLLGALLCQQVLGGKRGHAGRGDH